MRIMIYAGLIVGIGFGVMPSAFLGTRSLLTELLLSGAALFGFAMISTVVVRDEIQPRGVDRLSHITPRAARLSYDRELQVGSAGVSYRYELYDARGQLYGGVGQFGVTPADAIADVPGMMPGMRAQYAQLTVYDVAMPPVARSRTIARLPRYEIEQ